MIHGRHEELQHLNDYLLGIGYKIKYADDFENLMHRTKDYCVGWYYDSFSFYIEYTEQGKFLIIMDCLIKTDLGKVYDTPPKDDFMLKYTYKKLEIPFEDANLKGIQEILCSNVKKIKEYNIEQHKKEIEKDFQ